MTNEQRLVFRFYGDFQVSSNDFGNVHLPHGTLDVIDQRGSPAGTDPKTVLRWQAADRDGDLKAFSETPLPNWHSNAEALWEGLQAAASGETDELSFVISRPVTEVGEAETAPRDLTFERVTAMDLISAGSMTSAHPSADLRIPCVTKLAGHNTSRFRIGVGAAEGDPAHVFSYLLAIPMPMHFGRANGSAQTHLWLGGEHVTSQPDPTLLQHPRLVFTEGLGGSDFNQAFEANGPRFGDFKLGHKVGQHDIEMPDKLLVWAHLNLDRLGLTDGSSSSASPWNDPRSAHTITLSAAETGTGLNIATQSLVADTKLNLDAQLHSKIPRESAMNVAATFEVTATDAQLRQPVNTKPFECSSTLRLDFDTHEDNWDFRLEDADEWMAKERAALEITKAEPQSFFPHIHIDHGPKALALHAVVAVRGRMGPDEAPVIERDPFLGQVPPVVVTLGRDPALKNAATEIPLGASFPGIQPWRDTAHSGGHHYHLSLAGDPNVLDADFRPSQSALRFEVKNRDEKLSDITGGHGDPLEGRLGSLSFSGVHAAGEKGVALLADSGSLELRPDPTGGPRNALSITLPIALRDVKPVTSDLPHGDRDQLREDWLIPATPTATSTGPDDEQDPETRFTLKVTETLSAEADHHLIANLFESSPDGTRGFDDVLVTRAPFGMMRLRRPPLDMLASEASGNVATYDSDRRVWQFRSGGDQMPISFPASATGESMDKPGQRKITDQGGNGDAFVRSRLSGPATAWIDTAELGRNFRTPEHNARALFAQRTEAGPGAELAGFAAELVYGLSTAWQRPKNGTALATTVVRLAETGALMGPIVSEREGIGTPSPALRNEWAKLAQAVAERPQHLEAIARQDGQTVAYAPAVFTDGLTFVPRGTAVIKPPVKELAISEPGLDRKGPKVALHGLDGGAFWGIEQRAFLERLLAGPETHLGSLEGLAFGTFGTSGSQTARFVNGALAIITETVQGRLASLRVEVTGRIGAFYHRAKHVVVYRRTTAASDQFEGLGGDSRRPILRKVEEFIDLQDAVRIYPDRANTNPRSVGPLRELRFGTTRINVDSAWAEEVGAGGWRVPLWNRRAADIRPVVYPKPAITAAMQGEDTERLTLQALCDPHKLCFYTNAGYAENERDTDLWPAVHGVDGLGLPNLNDWAKAQDERAMGDELPEGRRAAASRFVPGVVAFTHCMSTSSALTKVNEARSDKPVFAALESFTFMRGGGLKTPPAKPSDAKEMLGQRDVFNAELQKLVAFEPTAVKGPNPLKEIEKARNVFELSLNTVQGAATPADLASLFVKAARAEFIALCETHELTSVDAELTEAFVGALRKLLVQHGPMDLVVVLDNQDPKTLSDLFNTDALNDYKKVIEEAAKIITKLDPAEVGQLEKALFGETLVNLQGKLGDIEILLKADKGDCSALADQARTAIESKKLFLREQLKGVAAEARALVDGATDGGALKAHLKDLRQTAELRVKDSTGRLGEEFGKLRTMATDARALVADWGRDLDRAYASGHERLAAFRNAYDRSKPWSLQRLDNVQKSLEAELSNLTAEATAALNQTRQRLASEIDKRASNASVAIDRALQVATQELESGSPAGTAVALLLGSTNDELNVVKNAPGPNVFEKLVTDAEGWITERAKLVAGHVKDAQGAADAWLASVTGDIETVQDKMFDELNTRIVDGALNPLFTALLGAVGDVTDELRATLNARITEFETTLETLLNELASVANTLTSAASDLCGALVEEKDALIDFLTGDVSELVAARLQAYAQKLGELGDDIAAGYKRLGKVLDNARDQLSEAVTQVLVAAVRKAEQAATELAELGKELADGIGRLVAASGKIPDIGSLGLGTDRVLAVFDDLRPDIDMSMSFSSLGRFGDALGAFNFKLPVGGLGDGFDLPNLDTDLLPSLNFEDLLPNIAGINFQDIVPDFGGAGNTFDALKDYIKVTHDVDKRAKTAWVKAELDLRFPKRAKLFGFGPFTLFLNKPKLESWVRIEANTKTKDVTTTEHGQIGTDIEAVVAGQPMVTLRDVLILYTEDGGLDFQIDPKKIKLHPNFQFVQDVLDGLGLNFGDTGLSFLKNEDGIPVGIEHKLALPVPPISAGTSGLVDLTIMNAFQLKAYPDFFIRNRFNLSTREKPFIFSIFVIGGTGFIQLDVDHLPADKRTTIVVTAGVGGSAALAFAFGPISGGVFITLMVILTYRKYLPSGNEPDAGLSVVLELAIAGQVSLWGIATILLRLSLSMTYHESGAIDATGRLSVTLRVSRFFKLKYATSVNYRMRDGKSVTTQTSSVKAELGEELADDLKARAMKLKNTKAKLV